MSTLQTEDEQVEAIKSWWRENGKAVMGGAALGLALVLGWQGWQKYSRGQSERASVYYEEFLDSSRAGEADTAQQGERLMQEFPRAVYAQFAALELARLDYTKGDSAGARARLQWVLGHADDRALAQLARLRLARLLLDSGDLEALRPLLAEAGQDDAYAGEFAALRGDLALADGDRDAARAAYREALDKGVADQALVRMKLTETGGSLTAS